MNTSPEQNLENVRLILIADTGYSVTSISTRSVARHLDLKLWKENDRAWVWGNAFQNIKPTFVQLGYK